MSPPDEDLTVGGRRTAPGDGYRPTAAFAAATTAAVAAAGTAGFTNLGMRRSPPTGRPGAGGCRND
ncbi:hypothetical protein Ppa06_19890 [Planomonospora parontospora subsp. parontospora]|uniref:Uncharacterized protein n=2 Tax=Planomonospora parontospora TaxID=58119 RepID=A0AA37BG50_9ACTN|nr:hypothetical protein [Planomonospora parontospora]GGK63577.1 hypothetical protein GCM10010126_23660 [Planomonospora parontospora]GII08191.1 hypothetical protein Ppa06_19890 [Planomonospora parontospora subsp. parontospora]